MNFNASGPASNNNSIAGGAMHQGAVPFAEPGLPLVM